MFEVIKWFPLCRKFEELTNWNIHRKNPRSTEYGLGLWNCVDVRQGLIFPSHPPVTRHGPLGGGHRIRAAPWRMAAGLAWEANSTTQLLKEGGFGGQKAIKETVWAVIRPHMARSDPPAVSRGCPCWGCLVIKGPNSLLKMRYLQ